MQKGTDWETRTLLKTNGELIPASHVISVMYVGLP